MILGAQLGTPAGAEQPTTSQLREIASLISSDDYNGLRVYLRAHPNLLVEDTRLSGLLRQFLEGSDTDARELDTDLSDALDRFSAQNTNDGGGASQY